MSNREKFVATILKNEHVVHHDVQDGNRGQNEYKTPKKNGPSDDPTDHGTRNNKRERSNSDPVALHLSPNKSKAIESRKRLRRTTSNSVTHMHYVKDGNNNLVKVREGDEKSIIIVDGYSIEDEAVNLSNETDLEAKKKKYLELRRKVEKNNDPNVHYEESFGHVVAMKMNNVATVREGDDSSSANKDEDVWFTEAKANLRKARTSLNAVDHKLNKMEGLINGADGKPNNGRTTGVSLTRDGKLQVVGGAIETFLKNVQQLAMDTCGTDMFEEFTEDDVKRCLDWACNLKYAFDTVCKGEIPVTLMTDMINSSFGKVIDNNKEEHTLFDILKDLNITLMDKMLENDDMRQNSKYKESVNWLDKLTIQLLKGTENTEGEKIALFQKVRQCDVGRHWKRGFIVKINAGNPETYDVQWTGDVKGAYLNTVEKGVQRHTFKLFYGRARLKFDYNSFPKKGNMEVFKNVFNPVSLVNMDPNNKNYGMNQVELQPHMVICTNGSNTTEPMHLLLVKTVNDMTVDAQYTRILDKRLCFGNTKTYTKSELSDPQCMLVGFLINNDKAINIFVRYQWENRDDRTKMLEVKQETTIATLKEMIEKQLINAKKTIDGLRILKDGKDLDYTGSVKSNGIQNECTLTLVMAGQGGTKTKFMCGQPVKILDEDATFLALHRDGKEAVVSFGPNKPVQYVRLETIKPRSRAKSPVDKIIVEAREQYPRDHYPSKGIDYIGMLQQKLSNDLQFDVDESDDEFDDELIMVYINFGFDTKLGNKMFKKPNTKSSVVKPSDTIADILDQYTKFAMLNIPEFTTKDYDFTKCMLPNLQAKVNGKYVDMNKSFRENGIENENTVHISLRLLGGTKRKLEKKEESDLLVELFKLKACCFRMYCLNTSQIHKLGIGNSSVYGPMISAEIMGPYEPRYSYNPKITDEALRRKYSEVMKREAEKAQVDVNGDIEKEMKFLNEHLNCERAVRDHLGKCFITRLFHEGCSINGDHVRNVVRPATKLIEEGKPNDYFFRFSYEVTEKKAADKKETERQLRAWQQCASKKGVNVYTLQHWGPKVFKDTVVEVFFRHSNGVSIFGTEDISSETVKTTEDGFKEKIYGETLYAFDVKLSTPWQHVNEIVGIGFPDKDENTEKLAFEEEQNIQDEVEKQIEAENQKKNCRRRY